MPRRILGQDFAPTTARTIQEVGTEVGKQQNFLRTGLNFAERTGEGITQSALTGLQATRELANTSATIAAQNQQRLAQGGGVGGILGGLSDLLEGYSAFEKNRIETALKRQKTQGKRELVFATQEMQSLLSDGDEMMRQQGAKNLEAQGLRVLGKYPNIAPTDIVPLTKDLYSKIESYRKAQSKKLADNIEAAAKFKQEVRIADVNNRASGIFQQIQDNPNLFVDKLREVDNLFKTVQEENPNLKVNEVAEIEAALYTEFLGRVQQGTEAYSAMLAKRNNLNRFAVGFAQIQQNPELGALERAVAVERLALETGVTEAYKKAVINVPSLKEQQIEAMELQKQYNALNRTLYEDQQAAAKLDAALQQQVAYAVALDPDVQVAIEGTALSKNVNYQVGVAAGNRIADYFELKAETDFKINQIKQQKFVYQQRMDAFIGGQGTKSDLTAIQELSRILRNDGLDSSRSSQLNNEIQEKSTDALFGTDKAERVKAQESWRLLKKDIEETYDEAIRQYNLQLESAKRGLEKYDLPEKLDEFRYQQATQNVQNQIDQGRQVMNAVPRDQGVGTGTSINFNQGGVNKFVIMRSPRNGQNMILPFAAGTKNLRVSGQHGDPRPNDRKHAGLDIAAPEGTPLISPVKGKVFQVRNEGKNKGYGYYIDIEDEATGVIYRYGHLQELPPLKAGDAIGVGDPIGKVGNTGKGSGPHLDLSIRRDRKNFYGFKGSTDPEDWLAQLYRGAQRKSDPPPGDNLELLRKDPGLETSVDSSQDHVVGATDLVMPGIGNLKDNRIVQGMSLKQAREIINEAKPYIHKLAPYDKNGWGTSDNKGSYGHAFMERNQDFKNKLNSLANELEIPGYWLADVIAYENGFNHKQSDLGADFFGIANLSMHQITELAGADFQTYMNGTPTEQLAVVGDYIKYNVDKYGAINNLGDLTAMFFAGEWGYKEYKEKGLSAFGNGTDGNNMTFQTYLEKIGAGTARKYKIPGRNANLSFMSPIHTEYHEQCSICRAMRNSGSEIVPHHGLIA